MNKKYITSFFFSLIRMSLAVYILFWSFLYFSQWELLYYPSKLDFYNCPDLDKYETMVHGDTRFYKLSQSSSGVLVHYQGNAWRACDRAFKRSVLESSWRDIILVEYSWFGWDIQKPSKELLETNVEDIKKYIDDIWYNNIAIYGESLGSWLASYHAALWEVDELILVNPFSSMQDVAMKQYPVYPSFLLTQNYDNIHNLKDYTWNVYILHGQDDTLISPSFSQKLYSSLTKSQEKKYILYRWYGHNDIWYSEWFQEDFKNIIELK